MTMSVFSIRCCLSQLVPRLLPPVSDQETYDDSERHSFGVPIPFVPKTIDGFVLLADI